MSCARALSLFALVLQLALVQLLLQVGRAGLVAVFEVAGLTGVLWIADALIRVESARLLGVITHATVALALLIIPSACSRRC
jgi:hypothetical protein